jgi:hypothetical protein
MPLLFQRSIGSENRAFTPSAVRKLLINALAATGLTEAVVLLRDGAADHGHIRAVGCLKMFIFR